MLAQQVLVVFACSPVLPSTSVCDSMSVFFFFVLSIKIARLSFLLFARQMLQMKDTVTKVKVFRGKTLLSSLVQQSRFVNTRRATVRHFYKNTLVQVDFGQTRAHSPTDLV